MISVALRTCCIAWSSSSLEGRAVLKGHARPVPFVAFSADGKQLLTKDLGHIALVWEAATGQLLPDAPKLVLSELTFLPAY